MFEYLFLFLHYWLTYTICLRKNQIFYNKISGKSKKKCMHVRIEENKNKEVGEKNIYVYIN